MRPKAGLGVFPANDSELTIMLVGASNRLKMAVRAFMVGDLGPDFQRNHIDWMARGQ
jgi:hypothetical protein